MLLHGDMAARVLFITKIILDVDFTNSDEMSDLHTKPCVAILKKGEF